MLSILLVGALGAVSFGGIGLLTASRAQKIESVSGLINLVMMPMWIFSGVFFSYERFPKMVLAGDPGAAADRAQRRFASDHFAGRAFEFPVQPDCGAGGMGWSVVRSGAALVPLELKESSRLLKNSRKQILCIFADTVSLGRHEVRGRQRAHRLKPVRDDKNKALGRGAEAPHYRTTNQTEFFPPENCHYERSEESACFGRAAIAPAKGKTIARLSSAVPAAAL